MILTHLFSVLSGFERTLGRKELTDTSSQLLERIDSRTAVVCVVGLGYVGVPLSVAAATAGFKVIGADVDRKKVDQINMGVCYVEDSYSEKHLPSLVQAGKIRATTSLEEGAKLAGIVIICVPTPLDKKGDPDLSYVKSVSRNLSRQLSSFKLIVLESTSFPGTTEKIVQPLLERGAKKVGEDFALAYSPERIDYGNPKFNVTSIPKVVGGIDEASTKLGARFYGAILQAPVISVSSPAVAEATKMLENTFRYVNIALVNELAVLHESLGVDFIEAIEAAATKPFGFMAHYPGPGIGGHCVPKDPFYLVHVAKKAGLRLRLISAATAVNKMMPVHVVERLVRVLKRNRKNLRGIRVALWGLAYKGQVKDTRRSPAIEILKLLRKKFKIQVYDPFVPSVRVNGITYESSRTPEESVKGADCILITTNHNMFREVELSKLAPLMKDTPILFDTRGIRSRKECERAGFSYLGTGRP